MKRLIIFLLLFAAIKVAGQTTGYLRFDTVLIYKQGGTAELILRSSTKDTLGGLFNYGNGKTRFMRSRAINDSTIVIGLDTIVIRGATGGSGSIDTTYTEKPIYVKTGTNDTLSILIGYGLMRNVSDSALRVDTSAIATQYDLTQITSGINQLTGDVTAGPGTGSVAATIANNAVTTAKILDANVTDAKISNRTARSVMGRAPNSVGVAADIASATANRVLTDDGSTLAFRQVDLTTMVTGALPEDNIAAFRTYPAERTNEVILYEKSAWTPAEFGAEFSRGANHTLTLNGSFPRIASSTIVWGGASVTRFLPQNPIIAIYDKIEMDYQIVTPNVGFGLTMQSNNVNGANFGYTSLHNTSVNPGTTTVGKQDGTNTQTGTSIAWTTNDVIRQTMEFRDTALVVTFQNLTTSSAVTTITKSFLAGTAPYPPNTGTWGFQNFSGTYEIRRIKITSRKVISPTLMVAFDSKGQIITTSWNARFPALLNARYPTVLNYSGGGDQLKDLIDKKAEFNRLNPEQVLIGLGSNDLRYLSSLATTVERLDKVVKMISGSTTRWAITIVPEDSTAGVNPGIGLTALKNYIAAAYPSNYIDLWTISSTSNVLKSIYNSGDNVHPNTEWHRIADSVIAASGFFSVQSVNRRTPYQKIGGGLIAIGDSLTDVFKKPFAPNSILKFNDSNQVVGTQMFANATRVTVSDNYQQAQTPTTGTILQVDGGFSVTGQTAFIGVNDKTNTTNRYTFQSDNNTLRLAYNGLENTNFNTIGAIRLGNTAISGEAIVGMFQIKRNQTPPTTWGVLGANLNVDSSIQNMPNSGLAMYNANSLGFTRLTATVAGNSQDASTLFIDSVQDGTNYTTVRRWSLYLLGKTRLGRTDSVGTATGGFLFKDFATGELKLTGAPAGGSGITSINSETGPSFTIAGGNGLTVNTTSNTATAVLGGTLSGATSIAGGGNSLNLGTGGSKITTLAINASTAANINSDARINILGNIAYQAVFFSSDATHSIAANTQILQLNTSALTTDRAVTLPSATTHGQTLTITIDFASSGSHYVLASAITDIKTGATFTQLDWGSTYDLMVNNSLVWTVIRKY